MIFQSMGRSNPLEAHGRRAMQVTWLVSSLFGCAHTAEPVTGSESTASTRATEWSDDADTEALAKSLAEEALGAGWLGAWRDENGGRRPVVRLAPIKNRTSHYIDFRDFAKALERAFVNSGRIEVIASIQESDVLREERDDQATYASDESAKTQGEELGSDFVLTGSITSRGDTSSTPDDGNLRPRNYIVSLEIVETQSNRKVWLGQKKLSPGHAE